MIDLAWPVLLIAGCLYLVYQVTANRKRLPSSARLMGTVVFEELQNRDKRAAVEEIMYTKESWTQDDKDGDDDG